MTLQVDENLDHVTPLDQGVPAPGDMVENEITVWADCHDNLFPMRTVGVRIAAHTPMLYLGMSSWKSHVMFYEGRQLNFVGVSPSGTFEKIFTRISSFCEAD